MTREVWVSSHVIEEFAGGAADSIEKKYLCSQGDMSACQDIANDLNNPKPRPTPSPRPKPTKPRDLYGEKLLGDLVKIKADKRAANQKAVSEAARAAKEAKATSDADLKPQRDDQGRFTEGEWTAHDDTIPTTGGHAAGVAGRGDSGANVTKIQNQLNSAGFQVDTDGQFGPGTEAAVKAFQTDRGLTPDGLVGPKTQRALDDQIGEEDFSNKHRTVWLPLRILEEFTNG